MLWYCTRKDVQLTEKAGCCTLLGQASASGFHHESDAVIALPLLSIHIELKYLKTNVEKNDLLIFNQKGIDFIAAPSAAIRRKPLYRFLVSGSLLRSEARRFALQWGINVIEPDRLPLLSLHYFAGTKLAEPKPAGGASSSRNVHINSSVYHATATDFANVGVPHGNSRPISLDSDASRILNFLQRVCGDDVWDVLDSSDPGWLEKRFDGLGLEEEAKLVHAALAASKRRDDHGRQLLRHR